MMGNPCYWARFGFCIGLFIVLSLNVAGQELKFEQSKIDEKNQSPEQNASSSVPGKPDNTQAQNSDNAQPASPRVGDYGDPDRLVVKGAKTFKAEDIKRALTDSLCWRIAATPSADLSEYFDEVKNSILAGCHQAGFPSAEVKVKLDFQSDCIVLEIDEGVRYNTGNIKVRKARTIPVDKLIKRLESEHNPPDARPQSVTYENGQRTIIWVDKDGKSVEKKSAVWEPGKPAAFQGWPSTVVDRYAGPAKIKPAETVDEDISAALTELGYYFPKIESWMELDSDKNTADLIIDVVDEGPGAEIGSIDIAGNTINSQEDIAKYLGIKPGMNFTRDDWTSVEQKLWESARFIKAEVTPMKPASSNDKILLHFNLVEYPHAPPLSKPLSAEEEILLKLQKRLSNSNHWDGDLVIRLENKEGKVELIQSPKEGMAFSFQSEYSSEDGKELILDYRIIQSIKEFGLFNAQTRSQFRAKRIADVYASLGLKMSEPYNQDQPHNFVYGFAESSHDDDKRSNPFNLQLDFRPVLFLSIAHERNAGCSLEDGVLTIKSYDNSQSWKIDATSGRLISFTCDYSNDDGDSSDKQKSSQNTKVEAQFLPGAFRKSVAAIHRESKNIVNVHDSNRPIGSFLMFVCRDPLARYFLKQYSYNDRWLDIADTLLLCGALDPLDQMINQCTDKKDTKFNIPVKPTERQFHFNLTDPNSWILYGAILNNELFPRSSWPWTLCQVTMLSYLQKNQLVDSEFNRLVESPDNGPLCCIAECLYLKLLGSQNGAVNYSAALGLERMSKEAFIKDCRPFFSDKHLIGKCTRNLAEVFRNLNNEEVIFIGQNIDEEYQKYLAQCDRLLRGDYDRPIDEVVPELLGALWDVGLESEIKSVLMELRNGTGVIR
jgi:hypothetical protein